MDISVSLEELGHRICILGPSNSGKSTLASAIAAKTSLPLIHLDQLHHQPGTKWIPRKSEDFHRLHTEAVNTEKWVMDGNYTKCLQQRLARATGLILLDVSMPLALLRYIKRCYSSIPRIGGLYTGKDSVTWEMLKYITLTAPKNQLRHRELFCHSTLPKVMLKSSRDISACCQQWGLELLR
ncbi:AAA family ATPase [Pantoea stewartii]|uniref:AAA family ATPase n=1 Tax=Pantoea stewartii TaxID=66269 RepID=UPI0025A02E74|nr:AAA family ATPase [Pantoea stewartii]